MDFSTIHQTASDDIFGRRIKMKRIFSGKDSRKLWKRINKTRPRKLRRLLCDLGCKLQKLEAIARKGAEDEKTER
jgi:hypothetical protein